MENIKLEELIARLYKLSDKYDLCEEFGGSEGEYQYATGKSEAYSFAADLLTKLRGDV